MSRKRSRRKLGLTLKGKIFLIFSLIFVILLIAIILLLTLPQFNLKVININELAKIEDKEILDKASLQMDKNIFLQNYLKAEKEILNIKSVKSVSFSIKLPDNINIHIDERKEIYQIKSDNGYSVIDEQGYFLKEVNEKITLPELKGINGNFVDEKRLVKEELEKLEKINKIYNTARVLNIDGLISEIYLKNIGFEIYFASNKKRAYFENTNNLMNSMQFVREILYSSEEKDKSGDIYTTEEGARFRPK